MKNLIIIAITLFYLTPQTFAQADFFENGTGGTEYGGGFSSTDELNTYFASLGSAPKANNELGFIIGYVDDMTIFQASMTHYILKQQPGLFFSVGARLGAEIAVKELGTEKSRSEGVGFIGGVLLSNAHFSETFWIQPAFSLSYYGGNPNLDGLYAKNYSLSFIKKISATSFMRINPSFTTFDNIETYSLTISFILSKD